MLFQNYLWNMRNQQQKDTKVFRASVHEWQTKQTRFFFVPIEEFAENSS